MFVNSIAWEQQGKAVHTQKKAGHVNECLVY